MKKQISIEIKNPKIRNYEKIISNQLKGDFRGRRFEYAIECDGRLILFFSSQKMKIKNVIKQFNTKKLNAQKNVFLLEKRFHNKTSVWRLVWEYKLPDRNRTLCLFEKTLNN